MNCPVCKVGKLDLLRAVQTKNKFLRLKRCMNCQRRFASEEIMYDVTGEVGEALKKELYAEVYMQDKAKDLIPKGNPKQVKPKEKRKVAPKPKGRDPEKTYLTYGDLFEKFKNMTNWTDISDYRPYILLDNSIIVWTKDGTERAYQYEPENYRFIIIENAKTYEEILAEVGRKKA